MLVWFLKEAPSAFLLTLAKRIRPIIFAPSESAPPDQLYIIHRGLALYGGKVLRGGMVWGEDACILTNVDLRSPYVARAMTFLECFSIDATDINETLSAFPDFAAVVRRRAVMLATRRAFMLEAERRRRGGRVLAVTHDAQNLKAQVSQIDFSDVLKNRPPQRSQESPPLPAPHDSSGVAEQLARHSADLSAQLAAAVRKIDALASQQQLMREEMGTLAAIVQGDLPKVVSATERASESDTASSNWL